MCEGENGNNGYHLAALSVDMAFAATLWLLARPHPVRVLVAFWLQ